MSIDISPNVEAEITVNDDEIDVTDLSVGINHDNDEPIEGFSLDEDLADFALPEAGFEIAISDHNHAFETVSEFFEDQPHISDILSSGIGTILSGAAAGIMLSFGAPVMLGLASAAFVGGLFGAGSAAFVNHAHDVANSDAQRKNIFTEGLFGLTAGTSIGAGRILAQMGMGVFRTAAVEASIDFVGEGFAQTASSLFQGRTGLQSVQDGILAGSGAAFGGLVLNHIFRNNAPHTPDFMPETSGAFATPNGAAIPADYNHLNGKPVFLQSTHNKPSGSQIPMSPPERKRYLDDLRSAEDRFSPRYFERLENYIIRNGEFDLLTIDQTHYLTIKVVNEKGALAKREVNYNSDNRALTLQEIIANYGNGTPILSQGAGQSLTKVSVLRLIEEDISVLETRVLFTSAITNKDTVARLANSSINLEEVLMTPVGRQIAAVANVLDWEIQDFPLYRVVSVSNVNQTGVFVIEDKITNIYKLSIQYT